MATSWRMSRFLVRFLVPAALIQPACAQLIDPAIAGHYQGVAQGMVVSGSYISGQVTVSLDMDTAGNVTASFSGNDAAGCRLSGSAPLVVANNPTTLITTGTATVSGCSDSRLNTTVEIMLVGNAVNMEFSFSAGSTMGPMTLDASGMTRTGSTGGGTTGGGASLAQQRSYLGGMWFNPNESGWGLSITVGMTAVQIPFVVLYVYSGAQPTWFVMPNATWVSDFTFRGDLYATTGVDYKAPGFDPSRVVVTKVGTVTITYFPNTAPAPSALLEYSVQQSDGSIFSASKTIVKQLF